MTISYEIVAIHVGREDWKSDLERAVAAELARVGLHRSIAVNIVEDGADPDVPAVAVYLASDAAVANAAVKECIVHTMAQGLIIVPVVPKLDEFRRFVPAELAAINGFEWGGSETIERLARALLEMLGIEDRQRRIFISHKREDGLGAAEQLHDRLTQVGFLPFIDRFAIPIGERVQDFIADALEEYAFLLLLETPQAHESDWVFDEVDYALSHTMGVLIVQWPGGPQSVPGSQGIPRLPLSAKQLVRDQHDYDVLTPQALEEVVEEIEAAHASGLVRRRRMLIRNVEDAAIAAGCTACVPLPDWRLLVEHGGRSTLVGVTPRLPTATDLQQLDEARNVHEPGSLGVLVHSARVLRPQLCKHLSWVAGDRDLTLRPENAIGGHWT
jgi:hypothetical protein